MSFNLLKDLDPIYQSSVDTCFAQAALVDEWDGHKGAQPWHLPEVDLLLSDDFVDVDVLVALDDVLLLFLVGCAFFLLGWWLLTFTIFAAFLE